MNLYDFNINTNIDIEEIENLEYEEICKPSEVKQDENVNDNKIKDNDKDNSVDRTSNFYDETRKKNILLQLNAYNESMRQLNGLTLSDKIINETANTYCIIIELMTNQSNKKKILRNQHKNAVLGAVLYYTMKNFGIIIDIEFLKKFMKCNKITNGINDLNTFCELTGYDITNGIPTPSDITLYINTCRFHLKLDELHDKNIEKINNAIVFITKNSISDNSNEKSLVSALFCMLYPEKRQEIYKSMIIKQTTIDKIINEYKKYSELMLILKD